MEQKTEKRPRGRPATGHTPQHQFRCPDEEWERFQQAADREGLSIAVWLRQVANRAANRVLARSGD